MCGGLCPKVLIHQRPPHHAYSGGMRPIRLAGQSGFDLGFFRCEHLHGPIRRNRLDAICRLDWFWSGAAVRDGNDEWIMESGQASSQNPGSVNSVALPLWPGRAQDIEWIVED